MMSTVENGQENDDEESDPFLGKWLENILHCYTFLKVIFEIYPTIFEMYI